MKVYCFEKVDNFTYLGACLSNCNEEVSEIKTRILRGGRCVELLLNFKISQNKGLRDNYMTNNFV